MGLLGGKGKSLTDFALMMLAKKREEQELGKEEINANTILDEKKLKQALNKDTHSDILDEDDNAIVDNEVKAINES